MRQLLRTNVYELQEPWLIDGATRTYCMKNGVGVWATNPSLVKHVGFVTSWGMPKMLVTKRFGSEVC